MYQLPDALMRTKSLPLALLLRGMATFISSGAMPFPLARWELVTAAEFHVSRSVLHCTRSLEFASLQTRTPLPSTVEPWRLTMEPLKWTSPLNVLVPVRFFCRVLPVPAKMTDPAATSKSTGAAVCTPKLPLSVKTPAPVFVRIAVGGGAGTVMFALSVSGPTLSIICLIEGGLIGQGLIEAGAAPAGGGSGTYVETTATHDWGTRNADGSRACLDGRGNIAARNVPCDEIDCGCG